MGLLDFFKIFSNQEFDFEELSKDKICVEPWIYVEYLVQLKSESKRKDWNVFKDDVVGLFKEIQKQLNLAVGVIKKYNSDGTFDITVINGDVKNQDGNFAYPCPQRLPQMNCYFGADNNLFIQMRLIEDLTMVVGEEKYVEFSKKRIDDSPAGFKLSPFDYYIFSTNFSISKNKYYGQGACNNFQLIDDTINNYFGWDRTESYEQGLAEFNGKLCLTVTNGTRFIRYPIEERAKLYSKHPEFDKALFNQDFKDQVKETITGMGITIEELSKDKKLSKLHKVYLDRLSEAKKIFKKYGLYD